MEPGDGEGTLNKHRLIFLTAIPTASNTKAVLLPKGGIRRQRHHNAKHRANCSLHATITMRPRASSVQACTICKLVQRRGKTEKKRMRARREE